MKNNITSSFSELNSSYSYSNGAMVFFIKENGSTNGNSKSIATYNLGTTTRPRIIVYGVR